jgi:hypothetical protein
MSINGRSHEVPGGFSSNDGYDIPEITGAMACGDGARLRWERGQPGAVYDYCLPDAPPCTKMAANRTRWGVMKVIIVHGGDGLERNRTRWVPCDQIIVQGGLRTACMKRTTWPYNVGQGKDVPAGDQAPAGDRVSVGRMLARRVVPVGGSRLPK